MSDNEETVSDRGYDTPVPELDDHRNHGLSVSRPERPRRGTFDTLYGTRRLEPEESATEQNHGIRVRDFEEVIDEDEDAPETSVNARRSRRPTVDSLSEQRVRAVSPPNSVKAFAEARRREREMSFSEAGPALKPGDDDELRRTVSITSRRSRRSRPMTVDDEAASVVSSKSAAEEDVCFPLQEEHRKDKLYIDFDYLENFILAEEAEAHRQAELAAETRAFPDLREDAAPAPPAPPMITVDGDFVDMPSDASVREEKEEPAPAGKEVKPSPATSDINRFSFFSSAWESTIHAPNLGGLVLPGENIRGLFTPPVNDPDGVWWLNMNSPTEEEVRAICKAFGIHPLTVEDILTQEAREKIELFNAYYFACFRSFNIVEDASGPEYEPFHIYVVVFREGILTFSFEPNSHAAHVRRRIALLKDYMALSSDWICYAVM